MKRVRLVAAAAAFLGVLTLAAGTSGAAPVQRTGNPPAVQDADASPEVRAPKPTPQQIDRAKAEVRAIVDDLGDGDREIQIGCQGTNLVVWDDKQVVISIWNDLCALNALWNLLW